MAAKSNFGTLLLLPLLCGAGCTRPISHNPGDKSKSKPGSGQEVSVMALNSDASEPWTYANDIVPRYQRESIPEPPARRTSPAGETSFRTSSEKTGQPGQTNKELGERTPGGFPVIMNHEVEVWIRYFTGKGRQTFNEWLSRAEAVKKTVIPLLLKANAPEELLYLAMIESGFSHHASSRAKASGPWQFVPATARLYGLHINFWKDERRDPVKSTLAAAAYLKDLRIRFGDWYLAMAAYNGGPGRVDSAIKKARSRNFWILSRNGFFNKETKNYVPKMLAAVILGNNPLRYGFDVVEDPAWAVPLHSIVLKKSVNLAEVARYLGISSKQLRMWNPELLHGISPPSRWCRDGHYALKLPEPYITRFEMIEPLLTRAELSGFRVHRLQAGETLSSISRRFKVSVRNIRKMNPGLSSRSIRNGERLLIPVLKKVPATVFSKG